MARGKAKFNCDRKGCKKPEWGSKRGLMEHQRMAHDNGGYPCTFGDPNCDSIQPNPAQLALHLKTHIPEADREFGCAHCTKRFNVESERDTHQDTHRADPAAAARHDARRAKRNNTYKVSKAEAKGTDISIRDEKLIETVEASMEKAIDKFGPATVARGLDRVKGREPADLTSSRAVHKVFTDDLKAAGFKLHTAIATVQSYFDLNKVYDRNARVALDDASLIKIAELGRWINQEIALACGVSLGKVAYWASDYPDAIREATGYTVKKLKAKGQAEIHLFLKTRKEEIEQRLAGMDADADGHGMGDEDDMDAEQ